MPLATSRNVGKSEQTTPLPREGIPDDTGFCSALPLMCDENVDLGDRVNRLISINKVVDFVDR